MDKIGAFFVWIIGAFAATLLGGIVLRDLWKWFVIPIFNMNELSIIQAIGLNFFVGFMIIKVKDLDSKDEEDYAWLVNIIKATLFNLMMWGFGYIIYLFY